MYLDYKSLFLTSEEATDNLLLLSAFMYATSQFSRRALASRASSTRHLSELPLYEMLVIPTIRRKCFREKHHTLFFILLQDTNN